MENTFEVILRYSEIKGHSNNTISNSINNNSNGTSRLTDIYLIINGDKSSTKKINLNNYELKKAQPPLPTHMYSQSHVHSHTDSLLSSSSSSSSLPSSSPTNKEKYFEFNCRDVGKIETINVSIDDDNNPYNCLYIDFIEVKIQNKSEAYKFPVERALGSFLEDGKCELDLKVWKHPERNNHIG